MKTWITIALLLLPALAHAFPGEAFKIETTGTEFCGDFNSVKLTAKNNVDLEEVPAEVLGRHILIMPDISPDQIAKARTLADSVHGALAQTGGGAFDVLAKAHADPQEPKIVEDVPFDKLPPEYQGPITADTALGLKPVITLGADSPRPKFVVLDVTSRHAEGELSFDDVKLNIRQTLGDQLAIRHFIDQLKRQTYINIRL